MLGPLRMIVGQRDVGLGGPKQRIVLGLLALRVNRPVGVDELMDDLWDEDVPGRPRKTLQVYIAHLRRLMDDPGRITSGPFGYRLTLSDDEFDLRRFEILVARARALAPVDPEPASRCYREALAIWTGPALADLRTCPALVRYLRPLDELRCDVAEEHLALRIRRGEATGCLAELLELTAADPLRERPWALLMEAYYRTGRQSDALATYQRVRALLADELGVDPGPELRRMERNILRQDPGLLVSAPDSSAVVSSDERRPAAFASFAMEAYDRLADGLDPEDLMTEVEAFRTRLGGIVQQHGGRVHAVDDGRLLACFGYPTAGEDDLLQAVRSGLAAARSGIAVGVDTGLALFRPGTPGGVFGNTPAVATRLQRAAGSGEVRLSAAVAALIGGTFTIEDHGDGTYTALAEQIAPADSLGTGQLWGRAKELALVLRAATTEPGPAVVLVWGEAGIGKTALTGAALAELSDRYATATTIVLRGDRHRHEQGLHPVATALAARYSDPSQLRQELGAALDEHTLAILDELAGWAAAPAARQPTGAARRRAVLAWLTARATGRPPLVVVFEDLHDLDPETRELLEELADGMHNGVLLITSRTDSLPLRLAAIARRVRLLPLQPAGARSLIVHAAGTRRLRTATINEIVRRAGGHPMHLRELTLATVAAGPEALGAVVALPTSLHASLLARLDSLGPAKSLAQRCAAVRAPFDRALAARLSGDEGRDLALLNQELDELVAEGVLVRTGSRHGEWFVFAHALLEDCAYASLSRSVRVELHRRIASWPESAESEQLAYHLAAAGDLAGAAGLWTRSAYELNSSARCVEASTYARQALHLLSRLPSGPDLDGIEMMANVVLATSLMMTGFADAGVLAAATRAQEVALMLGRTDVRCGTSGIIISALQALGRFDEAALHGDRVLAAVDPAVGGVFYESVRMYHIRTLLWLGRLDDAAVVAAAAPETVAQQEAIAVFGVAIVTAVLTANVTLAALAAFTRDERDTCEQLLQQAAVIAGPPEAVDSLCLLDLTQAVIRQLSGDVEETHRLAEAALERAIELGNDRWYVWSQVLLGWSISAGGNPHEGLAMMLEAIDHSGESLRLLPYFNTVAATGELALGRPADALARLLSAIDLAERTGERLLLPYTHLMTAEAETAAGLPPQAAAIHLQRAHALAEQQGQHWFLNTSAIL
ncbi:hypothetical protein L083_2708 [Actinoplanes sp. N902-109]|nr:hypothetical protein L083_2708 [Actinoplanes sp. N902-109]